MTITTIRQSGAGLLQERVAFDERVSEQDGYGNTVDEWVEQFQTRAQFIFLRGGEDVMAARLEGRQPVVVSVRRSCQTMRITPDWQMRDARRGVAFNIRGVKLDPSRGIIELTCEGGINPG